MKALMRSALMLCVLETTSAKAQQDSIIRTDSTTIISNTPNADVQKKKDKILIPAIIVGLIIAGTILLFNVRSR